MMPKHDGFSVLRHMQANPRWKDIPVILYSAFFEQDNDRTALEMGARAYLVKGAVDVAGIVTKARQFAAA